MPEFVLDDEPAGFARIKVIGVGGGGCNAVDSMFDLGLQNVEFYVINTDLQALKRSKCPNRIQIGSDLTQGRGCGAEPSLGEKCMFDAQDLIIETLQGADIAFVTAGLGGGTGTGGSPVVAQIAKDMGILTVSVVSKPFKFEGPRRMKSAINGLDKIREGSDTVIVINNERLLEVVGPKVPMKEAFAAADKVLSQAVMSISDLVTTPGLINVDFNDIRTIMGGRGGAVMGVGLGKGESRACEAVKKATNSPLLDKVVIDGATGILISITGGPDMTLSEVSEATDLVAQVADPDAEIIFGTVIDESMGDSMRVTLIATGFSDELHRKREIERAMETAPVAQARARMAISTPAPVAEPAEEAPAPKDELDFSPIFNEAAPEAPAPAPAPSARRLEEPRKPSLRESLQQMIEEDDHAPSNGGNGNGNGGTKTNGQPAIRVAPKVQANGGAESPARPSGARMVRSTPRPVSAVDPSESSRMINTRPAAEEPVAKVPQFTPAEEKKEEEDYDTPAFLRRRRSLFD